MNNSLHSLKDTKTASKNEGTSRLDQLVNADMMDAMSQSLASTKHLRVYVTCALGKQHNTVQHIMEHARATMGLAVTTTVTAQATMTSPVGHST